MNQTQVEVQKTTHTSNPIFIEQVLRLYAEGFSALNVAKKLGTSHTPVRTILKANNISTAPKKHWKGNQKERRINGRGYAEIFKPEHPNANEAGYVKEHVWLITKQIGRGLTRVEVVHHKNSNKLDNRLLNLQLMTRSEHTKLHWKMSELYMKEHFTE